MFSLFWASVLWAKPNIAIQTYQQKNIHNRLRTVIENHVYSEVSKRTQQYSQFELMPSQTMLDTLKKENKIPCVQFSKSCQMQIGKALQVNHILSVELQKNQKRYTLTLKLMDTQTGAILAKEERKTLFQKDLIQENKEMTFLVLQKGLNIQKKENNKIKNDSVTIQIDSKKSGIELAILRLDVEGSEVEILGTTPIEPIKKERGDYRVFVSDRCFTGPSYVIRKEQQESQVVLPYDEEKSFTERMALVEINMTDVDDVPIEGDLFIDLEALPYKSPTTIQVPLCTRKITGKDKCLDDSESVVLNEKKRNRVDLNIGVLADVTFHVYSKSFGWDIDGSDPDPKVVVYGHTKEERYCDSSYTCTIRNIELGKTFEVYAKDVDLAFDNDIGSGTCALHSSCERGYMSVTTTLRECP